MTMKTTKMTWAILAVIGGLAANVPVFSVPPYDTPPAFDDSKKDQSLDGKIEAVNTEERTFTVGGKTIYTTDTTTFTKGDKKILLSDIMVGDEIHAMTHDTTDGKVEASSVEMVGKK
jgi:hypothetical protein